MRLAILLGACLAGLGTAIRLRAPSATTASAYASSSDGTYKLSAISGPVKGSTSGSGTVWNLSIDDTPSGYKQNITGFGAAVTDATVQTINNLTSSKQTELLNLIMNSSAPTGAGFNMMRHTVGSSDLSSSEYTYDDSSNPDPNLTHFDLTDQGRAMATLLARMKSINGNLFVLGTPWSAPGWMKENRAIDLNGTTHNRLSDSSSPSGYPNYSEYFANYFVQYLKGFKQQNITIDAIAIQNEPLNNQQGYPTMNVTGPEAGSLILNHVGPGLANNGFGTTEIWGHELNVGPLRDIQAAQAYVDVASKYVKTIAWHCYYKENGWVDWSNITAFHSKNNNTKQFMTECGTPSPVDGGHWYGAANFTIGPLRNWAGGSMAWTLSTNMVTDENGTVEYGPHLSTGGCSNCRGLVTVNSPSDYTLNIAYYNMAQFSKFMPRGARVLNGTGSDGAAGVQSVATLNQDGTRTVAILNIKTSQLFVVLKTGSGETWGGSIPAQSIVTWILPKAS